MFPWGTIQRPGPFTKNVAAFAASQPNPSLPSFHHPQLATQTRYSENCCSDVVVVVVVVAAAAAAMLARARTWWWTTSTTTTDLAEIDEDIPSDSRGAWHEATSHREGSQP